MWKWRENKQMNQGIYWRQRRRLFQRKPDELTHTHTHTYILTHTPYIIICVHIFIYIYLGEFDLSVSNECASTTLFDNIHEFPRFLLFQYRKICNFLQTVYEPSHCDLRRTFIYLWKRIPCPFFLALKVFTNRFAYLKSFKSWLHLELTYCWLIWEK